MCVVRGLKLGLIVVVVASMIGSIPSVRAQETVPNAAPTENAAPAAEPAEPVKAAPDANTIPAGKTPAVADSKSGSAEPEAKKIAIPTDLQSVIELMGIWMIPYVVASVIMVWFTLERLVVLRRGRVIPRAFVKSFLADLKADKLDQQSAMAMCEKNASPTARLFVYALQKWGRPAVEVEQAVIDGGERIIGRLRTHVRALNTISVIMPMVGLLGTVVGLIGAFNDIAAASAMGNIDLLAANIAIALLTTAFGLGVAIPALTIYIYLCGRVEALVMEMDELGQQVAFAVSTEGFQYHASPSIATAMSASAKPRAATKRSVAEDATT